MNKKETIKEYGTGYLLNKEDATTRIVDGKEVYFSKKNPPKWGSAKRDLSFRNIDLGGNQFQYFKEVECDEEGVEREREFRIEVLKRQLKSEYNKNTKLQRKLEDDITTLEDERDAAQGGLLVMLGGWVTTAIMATIIILG